MRYIKIFLIAIMAMGMMASCEDLTDLNRNPNAIEPDGGNVNLLMPSVLGPAATNYLSLGLDNMGGAMQFIHASGCGDATNYFDWDNRGWESYYNILRTNELMIEIAARDGFTFHEAVGLTMRGWLFGQIADYWGDAPYSAALQAQTGEMNNMYPTYDTQEQIYEGILEDFRAAAALFATGDNNGVNSNVDLYYGGDMEQWEKFVNSLLIRYLVRISEKKPEVQSEVEAIIASGRFITSSEDNATMDYTGGPNDQWPFIYTDETSSTRYMAASTMIEQLDSTNDPRLRVWYAPVTIQWVPDNTISGATAPDKMLVNGVETDILPNWIDYQGRTETFTKLYNPNDTSFVDTEFVGVPPGMRMSDIHTYNGAYNGAQGRFNHHVSTLHPQFMDGNPQAGDLLKARIVSAAQMHFTLAELAVKGWNVGGTAEEHYMAGIQNSLNSWGVGDQFDQFYPNVAFDGTLEQVMTQKWVASFTNATEAWLDYRRTGLPELTLSTVVARAPVPALRFGYGDDELNNNTENVNAAIDRLETTEYSGAIGKNSVYSKPWVLQGTGNPW